MPRLLVCLLARCTSLIRLYRSMRKLSVGPCERRTMRSDGATSVSVNASRWVTCSAGAIVKKSFSLLRARSCARRAASARVQDTRGNEGKRGSTDPEAAGGVGLHDLADVAGELGERVADLAVLDDERLGHAARRGGRGLRAQEVRPVLAFACHRVPGRIRRKCCYPPRSLIGASRHTTGPCVEYEDQNCPS